jgi:hypothetical protein
VPKEMEYHFQSGDLVEVVLIEKKSSIHYSSDSIKLSEFKLNLIKDIFLELRVFKGISQIFIVGSFLTQKQDYKDIDIILISEKNLEKEVYNLLLDKFELRFHIISIPENKFKDLQRYCPLTQSMLFYFISNKEFKLPKETEINKDHIRFLLMMPEDILKIKASPKVLYDSIRRLITIERFLQNLSLNSLETNKEIQTLISQKIVKDIRNNELVNSEIIEKLRDIIKLKLKKVNSLLKKHE